MSRQLHAEIVELRVRLDGILFRQWSTVQLDEEPSSATCRITIPWTPRLKVERLRGMHVFIAWATGRVRKLFGEDPGEAKCAWPMWFDGVLQSTSESHHLGSHNVQLVFEGKGKFYSQCKLFNIDPSRMGGAADAAGAQDLAMYLGNRRYELDMGGVLSKESQLLQGMLRKIEAMTDAGARDIAMSSALLDILRSAGQQSAVFDRFDRMYKLSQRFAAFEDPDVHKLLDLEQMARTIDGRSRALGKNSSVMDVLQMAADLNQYNFVQVTRPRARFFGQDAPGVEVSEEREALIKEYDDIARAVSAVASGMAAQADDVSTRVGSFNLTSLRAAYTAVPERSFLAGFVSWRAANTSETLQVALVRYMATKKIYPKTASRPKPGGSDDPYDMASDGQRTTATARIKPTAAQASNELISNLTRLEQEHLQLRDQLAQFAVVPQLQFSSPPRCNVITPAGMQGWGMTRQDGRAPTRLIGRVPLIDGNSGVVEFYIEPSSQALFRIDGGSAKTFDAGMVAYTKRLIARAGETFKAPAALADRGSD